MFVSGIRRLAGIAVVTGAFAALVPVATADSGFQGSPDAIDRAVAAIAADTSFQGSPDAIDRAVAARKAQLPSGFQGSPDAMDRLHDAQNPSYAPDAFERALVTNSNARTSVAAPVVEPTESVTTGGFDWSDFGLGAGLMLALVGLGAGIVAIRRNQQSVKTA